MKRVPDDIIKARAKTKVAVSPEVASAPLRYWFKRRRFGWGWTPATWHGWFAIGVFIAVCIMIIVPFVRTPKIQTADVVVFLIKILGSVVLLLAVCYRTGEPARLPRGLPKDEIAAK